MERPPATDDGAHDRATAPRAGLARARVHLKLALHSSLVPTRVDVVASRGAAEANALAERPTDRLVQSRDLFLAQRASLAKRMDPRAPERFDGVDVPDARDRALIQKQHLDRGPRATAQEPAQPRHREATRERLLPERGVERHLRATRLAIALKRRRVDHRHPSELSRVGEAHRGPIHETDLSAHVALVHFRRSIQQLAGHAERDDERLATVEIEDHELASAAHVADSAASQARADDLRRLRLRQTDPPRLELADGAIDDEPAELSRDGLDLRELRHSRWRGRPVAASRPSSVRRERRR